MPRAMEFRQSSAADTCRGHSTSRLTEVKSHKRYASSRHREEARERGKGHACIYVLEYVRLLGNPWSAHVCPLQQQLQMNDFFVLSAECAGFARARSGQRGEQRDRERGKLPLPVAGHARGRCQRLELA